MSSIALFYWILFSLAFFFRVNRSDKLTTREKIVSALGWPILMFAIAFNRRK